MERFGQSYGYILYRTQLPTAITGDLILEDLHDYAQIYIDGKLTGTLDRRNPDRRHKQNTASLTTTAPARLDILVANDGRINSTRLMRLESKGITHAVTLAGHPLTSWQIYPLPMTALPKKFVILSAAKNPRISPGSPHSPEAELPALAFASRYPEASASGLSGEQTNGALAPGVCPRFGCLQPFASPPTFRRAHFTLTQTGDTFLDVHTLGKGALWINGHPIGRFWNIGPQQTLYVPAPWLRKGTNEIVVFDLLPPPTSQLTGLSQPILNGPVPDQTTSKQE